MSGMWAHFDATGKRCAALFADFKQGQDITKYTTNGTEDRRVEIKKGSKRNESPTKSQGNTATSGGNWKEKSAASNGAASKAASGADVLCGSHLKTADDLTGFPTFPSGTKSSLARNLSREIWNKYQDQKDKYGFSFK
jgi:hypothetical protein